MSARLVLLATAVALLAACSDTTGPSADLSKQPTGATSLPRHPTGGHPVPLK